MLVLGYWDIRCLAEPIRFLLLYKNVPFEDKRYAFGKTQKFGEEWIKDKFTLGFDFPNLPYLIDGGVKLTQSTAILRYLSEKYGLDGNTDADKLRVSFAEQQADDFRWKIIRFSNLEEDKPEFLKYALLQLKLWETYIGDGPYVAGSYVTHVDFLLYETFDYYRIFEPALFRDFPTLRAYHDRIRSLPQLRGYLEGPTYKRWPIFGPLENWGGGGEEPEHICDKA